MKAVLLVLGCLLLPRGVAAQSVPFGAGNVALFWEYPLDWQARVGYEVTITRAVNGRAVRDVFPLTPAPAATCHPLAVQREVDWTAESLCAVVCVAPGDLSVVLRARAGGTLSGPSNEIHHAEPHPCLAATPPPPAPRPAPTAQQLPAWAVGAGAVVVTGASRLSGPPPTLPELVNRQCVSWRIVGPCVCPPAAPCLQVEYFEPTALVEIVKHPGTSTLPVLGTLLKAGLQALGVARFGGGGAGNASGSGHTNLQYAEAHTWTFPQIFGGPCTGCAPLNALPRLLYASEADAAAWRTTTAPLGVPPPALVPVGTWGSLFPRTGFVIHHNPVVAGALQAFRALNIATLPVTGPPVPEAHLALGPPSGLSACLQLGWPKQSPCFPAGTPEAVWTQGAVSANGTYLFLAWSKRSCCVPAPGTCGITLPGVGSHGGNLCPF